MNPFKEKALTIDISAIREPVHRPGTTYFSWDRRTGKKIIRFLNEGEALNLNELDEVEVILVFHFVEHGAKVILDTVDGSVEFEDRENGVVSVVLPNDLYQNWGEIKICAFVKWLENGEVKSFDAGEIKTQFEESCLDRELPEMEQFYIRRFENLARDITEKTESIKAELAAFMEENKNAFLDWFQQARDTLSEDAAGNLFNMFWEHERKIIFEHPVHGIHFENGRQLVYIPRVGWVHVANAFRATWAQRDAMGLTWAQRDAMGLTWIELDNMKGVVR